MKKLIWVILPVLIVGVVLISVFAVQKNNLAVEVTRLQTENEDLNRHLDEVDMAVKTAQQLAETMVQETKDQLNAVTAERDQLKATTETAAAELNAGIRQLKSTLGALGIEDSEALMAVELKETKDQLDAVTAERDALIAAAVASKIEKTAVTVVNDEGETVKALEGEEELVLADLTPGDYTVTVTAYAKDGSEAVKYSFPYSVAPEAAPEALPEEQPAAEEAPKAEEPKEEEAAQPAEAQPEEAPAPEEEAKEQAPAEAEAPQEAAPAEAEAPAAAEEAPAATEETESEPAQEDQAA